jgi:hypothetical protein
MLEEHKIFEPFNYEELIDDILMSRRLKNLVREIKVFFPECTRIKNVELKPSKVYPGLFIGTFTLVSENKE